MDRIATLSSAGLSWVLAAVAAVALFVALKGKLWQKLALALWLLLP